MDMYNLYALKKSWLYSNINMFAIFFHVCFVCILLPLAHFYILHAKFDGSVCVKDNVILLKCTSMQI